MQKITPFIALQSNAAEAIDFYVSIFDNSSVVSKTNAPGTDKFLHGSIVLNGQDVMIMESEGDNFKQSWGFSMYVNCDDQAEVDRYWNAIESNGGKPQACGWIQDKFGVHWQIIPEVLGRYMSDPDSEKSQRVMQAMLKMVKMDVAELEKAYRGE